ncbi:autotransporter domain-containing protein [Xanthomonas sp. XNM01]|uniref:autotransporter outer membrane beta-barrel domain-containing protein n=1 Tax=Xanthomonas sp. XNM01 TaxID=2769289 RepID=UPI00177FFD12|nr:autotransporter domain-containing protein [Xanthomonas sp. XNM01]MBD9367186.1 autotransporter domain-containing protein [Xanthomonas sp. XNM01]
MSPRPLRTTLAIALALAAAPALATDFSGTVFFGDSLTDSGHFRTQIPEAVRPVTGKFTTNPGLVWAEHVARYYGGDGSTDNTGGDNYAQGGSRVTVQNGPAESTVSQVTRYLASTGGRADPNALYSVWTGANDIFAVAAGAPVASTLQTAVTGVVQSVGALDAAGARYILVPNLPDMGITPQAIAAGPAGQAALTQLSSTFNTSMYGALAQAGYQVIPLDTFGILREIVASPATYGFRNVTQTGCLLAPGGNALTCNPTSYRTPDAAQAYLFADGVHPSDAAHGMLGQYAVSVLEAPTLNAVLSQSATVIGRARAEQVAAHLQSAPTADGTRWWGGIRGDNQRYDHADLYDGMAPSGLFGVDWARDGMVFGGFLGYGRLDADFGQNRGGFTQSDVTIGGFAGWYGERTWVNAQASYTRLDYDVDREVHLGPALRRHSGSADGRNVSVGLSGGYSFGEGAFTHGPVASLLWQKVEVDGYTESNTASTALIYGDQEIDSLVGSLGWQASYDIGPAVPYIRATWDREFEDRPEQAFARLQTLPGMQYAVPGMQLDDSYGTVVLGARTRLLGLDADIGARSTVGRSGAADNSVFVTFSGGF